MTCPCVLQVVSHTKTAGQVRIVTLCYSRVGSRNRLQVFEGLKHVFEYEGLDAKTLGVEVQQNSRREMET